MNRSRLLIARRRAFNAVFVAFCGLVTVIALLALSAILWTLVSKGIGGINPSVFVLSTPAPGSEGGLANAIFGSLMMVGFATFIATPIGILVGFTEA